MCQIELESMTSRMPGCHRGGFALYKSMVEARKITWWKFVCAQSYQAWCCITWLQVSFLRNVVWCWHCWAEHTFLHQKKREVTVSNRAQIFQQNFTQMLYSWPNKKANLILYLYTMLYLYPTVYLENIEWHYCNNLCTDDSNIFDNIIYHIW